MNLVRRFWDWLRRVEKPLSAVEKMEVARDISGWAHDFFTDIHTHLSHANALLDESVDEHVAVVDDATRQIAAAKSSKAANDKIIGKVSEFIS